jgi:hypothetical protein
LSCLLDCCIEKVVRTGKQQLLVTTVQGEGINQWPWLSDTMLSEIGSRGE